MEDADVIVDPAEVELDPASEAYLASEEADKTTRVNVETLREFSQRDARGQAAADRPALPRLAGRDQGRRQGREDRDRPQRAGRGGRHAARQGLRRARRARVRAGAALGRLHRRPDRGRPLRREARPDPQRGRPRARLARLRPQGRPLHGGLDQARPLGRDRHQQERRPGDRPAPARRRRQPDPARPRSAPSPRRSRSCSPSAASASSASRTGRRSTRPRSAAASRTAARGSSSSASRRCSARSAKKSASRPADKKLHFRAPHARPGPLACGAWSRCDPPGPIHAWTISPSTPTSASMRSTGASTPSIGALDRSTGDPRSARRDQWRAARSVESSRSARDLRPSSHDHPGRRRHDPTLVGVDRDVNSDRIPASRIVESRPWRDLAELKAMIEAALPGAAVEVSDEDRRRRPPAGDGHRRPVRGPLADRPAPPGQGRGQGALRRRHDPRALGEDRRLRASERTASLQCLAWQRTPH